MSSAPLPREAEFMKHAKRRDPRAGVIGVAASVALVASCSSSDGADWSLDQIEFDDGSAIDLDTRPERASLSPVDGSLLYAGRDEICLQHLDDSNSVCESSDVRFNAANISWSADGTSVLLTGDFERLLIEPDIATLDVESLDLDVLTDDDVDEPFDDDAITDVAPFFGPDDAVHFLRSAAGDADFEVFRLDDDGDAAQAGSLGLPRDVWPSGPVRHAGNDRWVVGGFDSDEGELKLYVIDFENEDVDEIDTRLDFPRLTDTADGIALVLDDGRSRRGGTVSYAIVDLDDDRSRTVDFDLDESEVVSGAGLAPDGSSIVYILSDLADGSAEVHAMPIENGRADNDEAVKLIDDRQLDDLRSDRQTVVGFGDGSEVVWTSDGHLILAGLQSQMFVFEPTEA